MWQWPLEIKQLGDTLVTEMEHAVTKVGFLYKPGGAKSETDNGPFITLPVLLLLTTYANRYENYFIVHQ